MDMRKIIAVAVAAMALAAIAMWLRPSESKRIRKVFATVSREIHKDGQEGLVVSTAKAHALAELVARQARFKIDEEVLRGVSGGRQLVQQIILVRGQADKIDVDFADISIAFDDERTASVMADVYVRGIWQELGLGGRDARQLEAVLEKDKDDDKWRFTQVTLSPVVAK